jgi:hypothetical protein
MRPIVPILAALALALVALPSTARAQGQTCVLLAEPDATVAPADARERVSATITEELRTRGLVVMASRDAQLRMTGQAMEQCSAIDCAPEVNRFLGTTFAVLTELTWLRGRPTMINVVLIGLETGHSSGGQVVIERGRDLADAVREAFSTAFDRWQADQQGQIVIDTSPEGAFVEIDGTSVGRSPIRSLVPAGVHTVRVTLEGYQTEMHEVTIDRHEERPLSYALVAAASEVTEEEIVAPPVERFEDRPHWANYVLGGGLAALGVGLAVSPIWTLATEGQVMDHGTGGTDTVTFGPVSGTLLAFGAASLIAGVIVLVVQPITEQVRVTVGTTSLSLEGSF